MSLVSYLVSQLVSCNSKVYQKNQNVQENKFQKSK